MRVIIDQQLCQGHAMCCLNCPTLFRLDEDTGRAIFQPEIMTPDLMDDVDVAAEGCPEGAILIERD